MFFFVKFQPRFLISDLIEPINIPNPHDYSPTFSHVCPTLRYVTLAPSRWNMLTVPTRVLSSSIDLPLSRLFTRRMVRQPITSRLLRTMMTHWPARRSQTDDRGQLYRGRWRQQVVGCWPWWYSAARASAPWCSIRCWRHSLPQK